MTTVNHSDLIAELRACEARLSLIDTLIPQAEKPLHALWEMRRDEHDLLHDLRRKVADKDRAREHYTALAEEMAAAKDQAQGYVDDFGCDR